MPSFTTATYPENFGLIRLTTMMQKNLACSSAAEINIVGIPRFAFVSRRGYRHTQRYETFGYGFVLFALAAVK